MNKSTFIISLLLLVFCLSCGQGGRKEQTGKSRLLIFAAASLTDLLTEVADSFEVRYPFEVTFNFASSGTLARQIEQGAAPDVFISASERWAAYLDSLGYLKKNYQGVVAQNELVVVSPINRTMMIDSLDPGPDINSLIGKNRLSIGDPAHVPAGKYAMQVLENLGIYNDLKEKLLPTTDVRSALMVVEMEEAPLGIVYKTDAIKSDKVKLVYTFPPTSHEPIVYIAGACNDKQPAIGFYEFLLTEEVKPIFLKYGFKK